MEIVTPIFKKSVPEITANILMLLQIAEKGQKLPKTAGNCQNWQEIAANDQTLPKTVGNCTLAIP